MTIRRGRETLKNADVTRGQGSQRSLAIDTGQSGERKGARKALGPTLRIPLRTIALSHRADERFTRKSSCPRKVLAILSLFRGLEEGARGCAGSKVRFCRHFAVRDAKTAAQCEPKDIEMYWLFDIFQRLGVQLWLLGATPSRTRRTRQSCARAPAPADFSRLHCQTAKFFINIFSEKKKPKSTQRRVAWLHAAEGPVRQERFPVPAKSADVDATSRRAAVRSPDCPAFNTPRTPPPSRAASPPRCRLHRPLHRPSALSRPR